MIALSAELLLHTLIREENMLGDLEDRAVILGGELGQVPGIGYECTAWLCYGVANTVGFRAN